MEFTAFDPDLTPTPGMRTVEVARYAYDSNGYLRGVWDPRLDYTDLNGTQHVMVTYDYSGGILSTLTPPAQEPWQFAYTTVPGDSGAGRLASVSRSALSAGTAVSTVVYRVPVSGAGAPYDLSAAQTARWGQAEAPTDAAAVFPPTQIPTGNQAAGTMPSSYERASIVYMDANGRTVNNAAPGGGIDATVFDSFGNVERTLTAGNRQWALNMSLTDSAAEEAVLAETLSTVDTYSTDGRLVLSSVGPEHDVMLANGTQVRGRTRTVYVYDEGVPGSGGPFDLVTTQTVGVRYTDVGGVTVDADVRTSTTGYDWTLRSPTVETVDPSGLALATRTTYDAKGKVTSTTTPAGGVTTNTPATRLTTYYTAAANATYPACGGKPQWDGLVCRTDPGGQAATGPELAYTVLTYDVYGQVRTSVESTSAGALRTVTNTFDGAGRALTTAITTAGGLGTAVPKSKTVYDHASGQAVRSQSLDAGDNVTAEVARVYDTLGRQTSYTDADGNVSSATYDLASRVATSSDGKATRTFAYDGGSERRGLPTQVVDSGVGTFTASYDVEGNPAGQTWPNGIVIAASLDETGVPTSVTYTQQGCGQSDCTIFTEHVLASAHGQWLSRSSGLSAQSYAYDAAGRLTSVSDTVSGSCTTRIYSFAGIAGLATNRTSLARYDSSGDGTCQTSTVASNRNYTYDTADRLTSVGTVYDALGRTLTTPAGDTLLPASGNTANTYYANDMVRSITQGSRTTTYTLDVIANRIRSWTDNVSGTVSTKINHYAGESDSPVWTDEGSGAWTRVVRSLAGVAAVQYASAGVVWQVVNMHGDLVAGLVTGTPGLAFTSDHNEFGEPRNVSDIGSRRYGWLGGEQRAADTPGGNILMGARLYNPATGRFGSVDPVRGGSANDYDYCSGDVVGCTDTAGLLAASWIWYFHSDRCRGSYRTTQYRSFYYTRAVSGFDINIRCRVDDMAAFFLFFRGRSGVGCRARSIVRLRLMRRNRAWRWGRWGLCSRRGFCWSVVARHRASLLQQLQGRVWFLGEGSIQSTEELILWILVQLGLSAGFWM